MTVTVLDERTALVVIDLQQGIVRAATVEPVVPVIARAMELASAFRAKGLPVVLVNVVGVAPGRTEQLRSTAARPADWAELVPDLYQQGDMCISKKSWSAFTETALLDYLRQQQVTQLVLAGIASSIGVESTARAAYELGFNVVFALDAMTDMNAEAQNNSVTRIFPRIGETGSTADIIALL